MKIMNFMFQSRTDGYFTFREVDRRHVAIVLAKSLEHLTDQSKPTPFLRYVRKQTNHTKVLRDSIFCFETQVYDIFVAQYTIHPEETN